MMNTDERPVYITNDVEAAGNRLGHHCALSFGTCVVTRDANLIGNRITSFPDLIFYTELRPSTINFEVEALKVGCRQLICLEERIRTDKRFDPDSNLFEPERVMAYLQKVGEDPRLAMERFLAWIERVTLGNKLKVEAVADTVFFDSGFINLFFGPNHRNKSPYGWGGLDLDSLYRGYTQRWNANLRELGIPDTRIKPHRADHDAFLLAQVAQKLLFIELGW